MPCGLRGVGTVILPLLSCKRGITFHLLSLKISVKCGRGSTEVSETELILNRAGLFSVVARPNGQLRQAGVARGVRGHAPAPREILNFSLSEMRFAAFSGPLGNFFSS